MNRKVIAWTFQALAHALFLAPVFYLSTAPGYEYLASDEAEIQIAFSHATQLKEACRERSRKELAKLPPNMRRAKSCPRGRSPLRLDLLVDGELFLEKTYLPAGLHEDMASYVFEQHPISAGKHTVTIRLYDTVRKPEFHYFGEEEVSLTPGQALIISFDGETGRFSYR